MRKLFSVAMMAAMPWVLAGAAVVTGPDGRLSVEVGLDSRLSVPFYTVAYDGKTMLEKSPLGFAANIGGYSRALSMQASAVKPVSDSYSLDRIKHSRVDYKANELRCTVEADSGRVYDIVFRVSDNDVAFRYEIPKKGDTGSIYIQEELTGFRFPEVTTAFICPQSDPMIGWKRTKPSYEEEYKVDVPMTEPSKYGHGYTFPCLFRVGDDGWVLVSETGVDSHYCASRLSEYQGDGLYTVAFPMAGENNGNGSTGAAMGLPGVTPWRTLTVGDGLKPIVETTAPWNVVAPLYESKHDYKYGRSAWSWIVWQDGSINFEDQKKFIDLAGAMGYEYLLVDNWWDNNIGRERLPELIAYAKSKGVELFMWYSSSGYWNDIEQGPVNHMDNPIVRKREMEWLQSIGVKGIKVDFFGGDKQETMRLYEAILSDADDHGLMVIFHGCTLPRGWERMYPNYVGSEAVLASENIVFDQHFADEEAFNATLHPFIRNTVGSMDFGGTFMNKRLSKRNDKGTERRTTDVFEIATAVLFQSPVQNFALTPSNLEDAPALCMDFMREVPTTWDETRFVDGYPGRYAVLARRHGDTWYIAGVNALDEPLTLELDRSVVAPGDSYRLYSDAKDRKPVMTEAKAGNKKVKVTMQPRGGFVIVK